MPRAKPFPTSDISIEQLEQMLVAANEQMTPEHAKVIQSRVTMVTLLTDLLHKSNTTVARIRRLFGLSKCEKSSKILPPHPTLPPLPALDAPTPVSNLPQPDPVADNTDKPQVDPCAESGENPSPNPNTIPPKNKRKGHGRIAACEYSAAKHIAVPHPDLNAGNPCPKCDSGKLYKLKEPAPILCITGRSPLEATCFDLEKLRCSGCGFVFTAPMPKEASGPKFDERACSMIAMLRYGCGMPHNRLEHLQRDLQTPIPSSTQWDVVNQCVKLVKPVYTELTRLAAQGQVVHNDDSYMPILQYMGKRRAKLLVEGNLADPDRTGLFTTAIIALLATIGHIALFYTGRKHAGENLTDVLKLREEGLLPAIQMSDALDRNSPKQDVVASNCLAHARRHVVDEIENYPAECAWIIKKLAVVFHTDNECKRLNYSDQQRLLAHQHNSKPIMDELHIWMNTQIDQKLIEPNSDMGKALNYFLKRWDKFTVFLRQPGAPIDNNICERALKMTIIHRKNSLFYRSQDGADAGDVFMSLIHTAELHNQNPFDYLTALQLNHKAVAASPGSWMPWNYKLTLATLAVVVLPTPPVEAPTPPLSKAA